MKHDSRDQWSFVGKIQSATDYVQELLTENGRLRRRMADLQKEKEELGRELEQLSRLLDRDRDLPSKSERRSTLSQRLLHPVR